MKWISSACMGAVLLGCAVSAPAGEFELLRGLAAYLDGDYPLAYEEFRPLAEQGDKVAQERLGWLYDNGLGISQDHAEAAKWYRRAGEQGNWDAQSKLGLLYYQGRGVPQDYTEAAKWSRKAAEQGSAAAQYMLAVLYGLGQGVLQDQVRAHMWANIATVNGGPNSPELRDIRDKFAREMTRDQIAEAQRRARECMESNYTNCD
ncbi:tetratricopeptide repeat protein [Thioalkalivibrio sp. AKL10]|uniref:tetratricopeptide repeat protein n=1 Tax=Thioalkalivibrio sp. AKL10 TaxID=1158158 RepID=UPI0018CBE6C9|nr:tetratricopeptide repeat protein [Thioalkalivibrio sp. AKL10]